MSRVAAVVAILVLAGLARAFYVGLAKPEQDMPGLAGKYAACTEHLLAGDGFFLGGKPPVPYVDRIPGYILVRAALRELAGTDPQRLGMAHGALAALAAALLALTAWELFGMRAGLLAGAAAAAWPPLWRSDTQLLETGAAAVALSALLLALVLHVRRASPGTIAGIALAGTAALCLRADYLLVPPLAVALAALLQPARRAWLALAVVLPLVVMVPWALRNGRVADGTFVSVGLGTNLLAAIGEAHVDDEPLFGDRDVALSEGHPSLYWPDPKTRDDARVRRALGLIAEHPARYVAGCLKRVAVCLSLYPGDLWPGGTSVKDALREWREAHPGEARYAGMFRATLGWLAAHPVRATLTLAWGPLLLLAASAGAWRLRRSPRLLLLLLAIPAYGVAVHVPLHAEPRYFFPFAPLLFVLAVASGRPVAEEASATTAARAC